MSLLSYLSEYPGTLNDKTLAWLKSWSPGFENGTTEDLWMLYLSQYSGSLNDRMLQWARATTSLPTASLGDALNALTDAGASYGGASLDLNFARQTYNTGAIGDIPPSVPFSSLVTFARASSATYFDSSGVLQTASTDAPRFDYDPVTLQPRGILIEELRTNLLRYSSDFTNAVWVNLAVVVTANNIVAPDGTLTAESLLEDSTNNFHQTSQIVNPVAGTYTASVYAKQAGRRFVTVTPVNQEAAYTDGVNRTATFDLQTGAITQVFGSGTSATITDAGNGWYRLTCTVTTNNASTSGPTIRLSNSPTPNSGLGYADDGTSGIYIWGAQLEAGAFPTSYIPTVASQVTRSADVASVNTLSPWYNASEGTLFVESVASGVPPNIGTSASLTDSTVNNRIIVGQYFTNTRIGSVGISDVNQAFFSVPAVPVGVPHKFAMSWKQDNFAGCFDGGTVLTDSSGSIPTVTKLNIGSLNTIQRFCGHIRSIRYCPRKLANSELQAITV